MHYDEDLDHLLDHPEWYSHTSDANNSYKPTDITPPDVVDAIKRINERIRNGQMK